MNKIMTKLFLCIMFVFFGISILFAQDNSAKKDTKSDSTANVGAKEGTHVTSSKKDFIGISDDSPDAKPDNSVEVSTLREQPKNEGKSKGKNKSKKNTAATAKRKD
jgi:hypothetical protein